MPDHTPSKQSVRPSAADPSVDPRGATNSAAVLQSC
jgi:hypothetical protein